MRADTGNAPAGARFLIAAIIGLPPPSWVLMASQWHVTIGSTSVGAVATYEAAAELVERVSRGDGGLNDLGRV